MKTLMIRNVAEGSVIPLTEVKDSAFSSGLMGEGYGVLPTTHDVFAPISGRISVVFKPQHAFAVVTEDNIEVLVHMGIKSAELVADDIFHIKVQEGDEVRVGDLLATFNLEAFSYHEEDSTIVVVITSMDVVQDFVLLKSGKLESGEVIGMAWY